METTLAVAPITRASNYKKERIFFKDRVRRKENESDSEPDAENKKERAREFNDYERKEYVSSQIMYIDDSVIMNGVTFLIDSDDVLENEVDAIADTERMLLEHYAQTFSHMRDTCASTRLAFQLRSSSGYRVALHQDAMLPYKKKMQYNSMALHVTGVWETEYEIGLEYKWIYTARSSYI